MNRSVLAICLSIAGLGSGSVGCSSEETTAPKLKADSGPGTAAPIDSGTNPVVDSGGTDSAAAADTGTSTACTAYCECMQGTCASKSTPSCLTACQAQTTWDVACRTQHCGYAKTMDPTTHCGHAAGESLCP